MSVPAMVDFVAYSEKPSNKDVGRIKNRIQMQGVKSYTLEEFYNKCITGHSFIPGVLFGGLKAKCWNRQQIFAIDVDGGIGVEEALAIYREAGLEPFAIYYSYSHTEENPKFRVLFCLDECIDDLEVRNKVMSVLAGVLGCADTKCLDAAHYFNGTSKGGELFGEVTIKTEVVLSLWKEEYSNLLSSKKVGKSSVYGRKKSDRDYTLYVDGDVVPFVPARYRLNAKHDVNALKKVFKLRRWKEGDHRERFIFVLYNVAKIAYGAEKALELVQDINEQMEEPLEERELYWAITHTEDHMEITDCHGDGIFTFNRETIASEKWLDMTEEETLRSGFIATKIKNDRANANRPVKKAMKEDIATLHREGKKTSEIEKILVEKYGYSVSIRTIQRQIKNDKIPQTIFFNIFSSSPSDEVTTQEEPMQTNDEPTLNAEQQLALEDALRGNNLVISGNGGGVGKTHLIRKIVEALEGRGKTVAVTAATALAAENIDGVTLHRAMKMYLDEDSIVTSSMLYNAKQYNTIIIDEASMIGAKTFECFCKIIEEVRQRYHKYIQVILVCDVLQLPPVNDAYFFQTECYENLQCNLHYLNENYRQNGDNTYLNLINKVRIEKDKTYTACELNRICNHSEDARYTYLTSHKSEAFVLNQRHLNNLEGELINLGNLCVKIGAKVIVTENNSRAGYYNGMQGIVRSIENNVVTIVTTKGMTVKLHRKSMLVNDEYVFGYPLDLGYAITIHKSQGMTLDGANINPQCFDCGQLYVALSRVKSASGVQLLRPIKPEYIKVNGDALAFDETMREEGFRRRQVAM